MPPQPRFWPRALIVFLALGFLTISGPPNSAEANLNGSALFSDDDGSVHELAIEAIAVSGVTRGCESDDPTKFCPTAPVTRGQMAAFLTRALDLEQSATDWFLDDTYSVFEQDINALAAAGITRGCDTAGSRFCPDANVTRGQAAALLVRAFDYTDDGGGDLFLDDDDSVFAVEIDRLATAGITAGCNPPVGDRFCPDRAVTRGQMASFLARAHGLVPLPGDFMMIGAGDIARRGGSAAETAAIIARYPAATVYTTGDHAYPDGTAEQFAELYEPTWGLFKHRTRPSIGNHDDHIAGAAPYFEYFGPNAGTPGEGWYSYDIGGWHVIALNSECGDTGFASCEDQLTWLLSDLEANATACMISYWHRPVFNSGRHSGDASFADEWAVLDAAGVDIVLAGHDHNYQRYALQDSVGNPTAAGMRQFIVGSGGAPPYAQTAAPETLETFYAGHGVLKLDLHAEGYSWEFITLDDDYTDTGNGTCG